VDFVLVVDEARIIGLLRHLSEVTAFTIAHTDLTIVALLVYLHRLYLFDCSTVNTPQHISVTISNAIHIISASV